MEDTDKEKMTMTFNELRNLGGDFTCTFEDIDESGTVSTGTLYVEGEGKNVRGEFDVTDADGAISGGSLIRKGNVNYIWTEDQPEGIMITLDEEDESFFGEEQVGETSGLDEEEEVAFECEKWNVDSTMFDPPADREFLDMEVMMQQMMEGMVEQMGGAEGMEAMKAAQCESCEAMTDATTKAQCKQALGC